MTWAERVGDLATNLALVLINFARIFTVLVRTLAELLDKLVTSLGETSEAGLGRTEARGWTRYLAAVAWGIAAVFLRLLSIVTVFVRQLAVTLDEFFRALAEGEAAGGSGT